MSFPLSFYAPPMKYTSVWDGFGEDASNAKKAIKYIKCPGDFSFFCFAAELFAPFFALTLATFLFPVPLFSLETRFSLVLLTTITTIATSPRALYMLLQLPLHRTQKATLLWQQKSLQKLLQWFAILLGGFSLISTPSPVFHFAIPLYTIACIIWPILLVSNPNHSFFKEYLFNKKIHYTLGACSLVGLFSSILGVLCIGEASWTSYLQLAACISITLICKDSVTELTESAQISRIKELAHTILCLGVFAYHVCVVCIEPISANVFTAVLISTHIFFVFFIDAEQEINDNSHALAIQQILRIEKFVNIEAFSTKIFKEINKKFAKQKTVAPWYFPARALLYALLSGANLLLAPLPVQPTSILLRVFFLSQTITNMTDCLLKQLEASTRKKVLDGLIKLSKGTTLDDEVTRVGRNAVAPAIRSVLSAHAN